MRCTDSVIALTLQSLHFSFSLLLICVAIFPAFFFLPFFSKDVKGSVEKEILVSLRDLLFAPKKQGLEGQAEFLCDHSCSGIRNNCGEQRYPVAMRI